MSKFKDMFYSIYLREKVINQQLNTDYVKNKDHQSSPLFLYNLFSKVAQFVLTII